MSKTVIITGACGGIGNALCEVFKGSDYHVIGLDFIEPPIINHFDAFLQVDLQRLVDNEKYRKQKFSTLSKMADNLKVLVNNAAVQIIDNVEKIDLLDWNKTLAVNLTAPMLMTQWAIHLLEKNMGSVINIASIHQQLTKPCFVSYATSKSALIGMTKSMAVDLKGRVRVNAISPAAIETQMLLEGFNFDSSVLDELKRLHPSQKIGKPAEVAKLAAYLASDEAQFINGANINIDGGISSALSDIKQI